MIINTITRIQMAEFASGDIKPCPVEVEELARRLLAADAELQAFRRAACNHGFPPGVHTHGVIGCVKCSGRKIMIWERQGGHNHELPGLKKEMTSSMALHFVGDPQPIMKAVCETCGENCTHPHHHAMTAVPVEPPISAEFKAARNTLKFLRYTWTGGEHWRPPLGLPPESVTGIDYKKLVEEIAHIVFGNLEHVENLPVAIRATVGRFRS